MSEVQRYGYLGIVEEEDGEVVKWEDYAALKADHAELLEKFNFKQNLTEQVVALQKERDTLAAENGLAVKAVQTFCDVVGSNTDVIAEEMGMEGAKAILAAMSATGNMPATDAYLNSVRAEGVEMFAKHCDDNVSFVEPEDEELYTLMEEAATAFAAQLRAGKDGE